MKKHLKAYLKREGINQNELARRLGVHRGVVSHWMTGYAKPNRNRVVKLAQLTGIRLEDLL